MTTTPRLNLSQPASQTANQPANDNQPQTSQKKTSLDCDDGSDLLNFVVPEIDDENENEDAPVNINDYEAQTAAKPEIMGKDAFWVVFKTVFSLPTFMIPDLRGLAIEQSEEYAARGASDATYSLLEIYYPNALMPQGEVFGHLMIAAPFFIGKAMIVKEFLRSRNAKPVNRPAAKRPEPPQAANDNAPLDYEAIEIPQGAAA